jgi:hypothetical protein
MQMNRLVFVAAVAAWVASTCAVAHPQDVPPDETHGLEVGKRAMSTLHQQIASDRGRALINSLEIHTRSVVKGVAIDYKTIWRKPLDLSTRTVTKTGSHQRGFVGGRGWSGALLLEGDDARRLAPTFCLPLTLLNLNAFYPVAEATGEIIFRDRRALRVQLHDGKSDSDHIAWIYFDQRNDIPLGMVFQWPVGINLHQATVYLDKWRPGGGVILPYRIEIFTEGGDRRVEIVRAMSANIINDRAFEPLIEGWKVPPATPSSPEDDAGNGDPALPNEPSDSE